MAITKNKQSDETIKKMAFAAFPQKEVESVQELTEGMCNAAYKVNFTDKSSSVLKIASENGNGLMSNEVNMMDAEVKAMRLVYDSGLVKVAKVQYYDTTKKYCNGNYFFMEVLDGDNYFWIKDNFTEEENAAIHNEIGQIERKISFIKGKKFGLLGDSVCYDSLYEFVYQLIFNVLSDAKKRDIDIGVDSDEILDKLYLDKTVFDEVKEPSLVHWDMWEGNVFVKEKHVLGIIDWERAMWGEAFMDDRFRRHTRNDDFLRGYGKTEFTKEEKRRICWYDVLLYLTMMTEGAYREYEDDSQYQWVKPFFEKAWNEIEKE